MKKFFNSNLFNGILAVIMAVFLLFYVASAENPVIEKPFSNINVAVTGLPEGYILESEPGPVEVRVSGYRSTMNLTFARDVKAYVDMSNAHPGTAEYVIHYTLPTGVSMTSIRPDYVELNVDVYESREFMVNARVSNAVRQGFSSLEPVVSPATVSVSGPRRVLDQIGEAVVDLDLADLTADFNGAIPITLLDGEGQGFINSRIRLSEEEVSVHVGVQENLSSKSVSVLTALSSNVSERYILIGMEVQPSTVKITGTYAAVSPIEYLYTEAIDLAPMTETYHGFVRLLAPPNVEILEGDRVEITIRIEKNLVRRTIEKVPVEIRNAPLDIVYEAFPETIDVTLAAFSDDFIAAIEEGELSIDIIAYIDLEGLPVEAVGYPIYVEAPDEFQIEMLSSDMVSVTLINDVIQ
ncbi:MAG: hypothetical protein LBH09_00115 [Peptococcaceae bacterium]|jgi:YbbR domain-containing protein|nr:hypothetical protein [Peptococcaceae bacterium]